MFQNERPTSYFVKLTVIILLYIFYRVAQKIQYDFES